MPAVELIVRCKDTAFGQDVAAVGSWNGWNSSSVLRLSGSAWPLWKGTLQLPDTVHFPVQYKYCIVQGKHIVRWENATPGHNRCLYSTRLTANGPPNQTQQQQDHKQSTIPREHGPSDKDLGKAHGTGTDIEVVATIDDGQFGVVPEQTMNHHPPPPQKLLAPTRANNGLCGVTHNSPMSAMAHGTDTAFHRSIPSRPLDTFEHALVQMNANHTSWRLRLSFVRQAFTDPSFASSIAFQPHSTNCLATLAIYLAYLSSGQVPCGEDSGHHRPNHHASEAAQIDAALDSLFRTAHDPDADADDHPSSIQPCPPSVSPAAAEAVVAPFHGPCSRHPVKSNPWAAYIARSIYPHLPSYSSQFTVTVPLTRIRDIAHRGDIPHELKQEIKHTLQNKLHRCAGPEDLQTCQNILERVSKGGYSQAFVNELQIFHRELREFFNAASLEERVQFLISSSNAMSGEKLLSEHAAAFLRLKRADSSPLSMLEALTCLRRSLRTFYAHDQSVTNRVPAEVAQKYRLADIELDNYAFVLLASIANKLEKEYLSDDRDADFWSFGVQSLGLALSNLRLSHILPEEAKAAGNELDASRGVILRRDPATILRVKAAVERAVRITEEFSHEISELYMRRVPSLSAALHVDQRASSVLAEAAIRSNVAFQASRLADAMAKRARHALNQPPWDPLLVGTAEGRPEFVDSIDAIGRPAQDAKPTIVICRFADGDEDIPSHVRGIVLGRTMPHLSHLGVRARQAGVVFVCAEDSTVFDQIWNGEGRGYQFCRLVVSGVKGLDKFEKLTHLSHPNSEFSHAQAQPGTGPSLGQTLPIERSESGISNVIAVDKATHSSAAAKCAFAAKLADVSRRKAGLFNVPTGAAIPFGVFESQRKSVSKEYERMIDEYEECWREGGDTSKAAAKIENFVQTRFVLDGKHASTIMQMFKQDVRIMVRSSANCEDLEKMSGAGLYDSIANIEVGSPSATAEAVVKVWSSLWSSRAASSRQSYHVAHRKAQMAVLLQEMIRSEVSFVAFSVNPVDVSDSSHIYIEAALGMGETLASARAAGQPYRLRVGRTDGVVILDAVASYSVALMPGDTGLASHVVDYSKSRLTTDGELRTALARRIGEIVQLLEKEFGGFQDIEGALIGVQEAKTVDDVKIYIVQARPQVF